MGGRWFFCKGILAEHEKYCSPTERLVEVFFSQKTSHVLDEFDNEFFMSWALHANTSSGPPSNIFTAYMQLWLKLLCVVMNTHSPWEMVHELFWSHTKMLVWFVKNQVDHVCIYFQTGWHMSTFPLRLKKCKFKTIRSSFWQILILAVPKNHVV